MAGNRPSASDSPMRIRVAAVIPNWNQADLTAECVAGVRAQVDHVYIVDNDSRRADQEILARLADSHTTLVVNPRNLGYAGGCNEGVSEAVRAGFDAILIMNNDAFPDPGSVGTLLARLAASPTIGAVGPTVVQRYTRRVLHADCSLDHETGRAEFPRTGAQLGSLGTSPLVTGYISGEAMLVRREAVEQIGMFDARYFCYYEDVDWSIRAVRAGWKLEVAPTAVFEHLGGATSAGYVGTYYRARNLPFMLRITCGRSRLAALRLSAPRELLAFFALLRRKKPALAFRGVLGGWMVGLVIRG